MTHPPIPRRACRLRRLQPRWLALAAALCLSAAAGGASAQAVVMAGSYQNFDVLNDTGGKACGFEMEVWGVSKSQLSRIFPSNFNAGVIRYGFGKATDFPGGVYVRWMSPYDAATGTFTSCTPVPKSMTSVPGDSCWTLGMPGTYDSAGCEHFGISTSYANPTKILYRWLVPNPAVPGTLISSGSDVALPAPVWTAVPPADPALPPVVVAEVPAPAPRVPAQYGDAQWVKVYKTEHARKVGLDELVGDNHVIVPEAPEQAETEWSLLQQDPPDGGRQRRRGKQVNQGDLGNGNKAVVRRYEYYKYAGVYDPITHEALCADLTCSAPSPGEIGNAIGAQNAAANLDVNSLTVKVAGRGGVSSSDRVISCGSRCYGVYAPGTVVTLTAEPTSKSDFVGWSGACAGNALTCTVPMNVASKVTATFALKLGGGGTTVRLVTLVDGAGVVTSTPSGIHCGATCRADYAPGSTVTLVATPAPSKTFTGWSGACRGTSPTCTLSMGDANKKTTATFSP